MLLLSNESLFLFMEQVDRPLEFNKYVSPICLPDALDQFGLNMECVVSSIGNSQISHKKSYFNFLQMSGFGRTETGRQSITLQFARVYTMNVNICGVKNK